MWYTRKNAEVVTGLQTSCYKSVVVTSLEQAINNLEQAVNLQQA